MIMSKPDTWMPLFIGDYMADTMHLSTEEHGAYLLLLMTAWSRGGKLPSSDSQLAQIARCDRRRWARLKASVLPFFTPDGDSLVQTRLVSEYAKALKINAKQRANGKLGGRPKPTQVPDYIADVPNPDETQHEPMGSDWDAPDPNPNETPSPSPIPTAYSVPSGTGVPTPLITDPQEIIFGYGVPLLTSAGIADKLARSFLGGLRKSHGDGQVVNALRDCIRAKPLQPLEWLAKRLPPLGSAGGNVVPLNKQEALEAANRQVAERLAARHAGAA